MGRYASWELGQRCLGNLVASYLVDPASSHMLVSKIKPCMCKYMLVHSETANGSLNQLWFLRSLPTVDNCSNSRANTCTKAPIPSRGEGRSY